MSKSIMMVLTLALTMGLGSLTFAATSDEGPGCGLGKVAWTGSGVDPKAIGPQLLMSTTNNTVLPWQAFGITSRSFGCTNNGNFWAQHKVNMFANVNFDLLSQEMAQGHGEHLASLATLMGIPDSQHDAFFSMTQQQYSTLVESGNTSPVAIIKALHASISTHPVLAQVSTK